MNDCGHHCCSVRTNPCHVHTAHSSACTRCAAKGTKKRESSAFPVTATLDDVVLLAMQYCSSYVREIVGAPDQAQVVFLAALIEYCDAFDDPGVISLPTHEQIEVIAIRTGLQLACPGPHRNEMAR